MIASLGNLKPSIGKGTFVATNASVIGDVMMGDQCSVWFSAVIRGDSNSIKIGNRTNIQDLALLHIDSTHGLTIGDEVTIGHRAILHGCSVGNRVLIGMGAIVMNGAQLGDECIIAAGALVSEGKIIPPRTLVMGMPGKVVREITADELSFLTKSADIYAENGQRYISDLRQ